MLPVRRARTRATWAICRTRREWYWVIGAAVTVTGRPVLVPVPVAVTCPVAVTVIGAMAVTRPVPMARSVALSRLADLAVVPVAVVYRPTDGGRATRFDHAVGRRGMAGAAGTRRRGGDRGQRLCRHRWCRGMRRGCLAALW